MVPNPPACSLIQASMAGSRSTAPLNRSSFVLIVATLFCFRDPWFLGTLAFRQQNPSPETVVLVVGVSLPANAAVFYDADRP
jgi:hypothetical protein